MARRLLHGLVLAAGALALPAAGAADPLTGGQLYQHLCASCHGPTAHGDGPVAPSLKAVVPDLTRLAKRNGGRFPDDSVYRMIDGRGDMMVHGPREMPVWGYELWHDQGADANAGSKTRELIDRLVAYLRTIQVGPVLNDPSKSPP